VTEMYSSDRVCELAGITYRQLTEHAAIELGWSWEPAGECMVFVNDSTATYGYDWSGENAGQLVHRAVYEHVFGPVGDRVIHHECETTRCFYLGHLKPLTRAQHAREHFSGADSHFAVLTIEQVEFIRTHCVDGRTLRGMRKRGEDTEGLMSATALAKMFGVARTTVGMAYRGDTWADSGTP
jgi:hypothetical protein